MRKAASGVTDQERESKIAGGGLVETEMDVLSLADESPDRKLNSGELRIRSAKENDLAWEVLRLRQVLTIGLGCWVSFVVLDWIVVEWLDAAPFSYFLICRGVGAAVLIGSILAIRQRPTRTMAFVVDLVAFGSAALLISLMALGIGGIQSPYFVGVIQVLTVRAAAMPAPWKTGLLLSGIPATIYPATMLVASLFMPGIATQFSDQRVATLFTVDMFGIYGCLGLVVLGSDAAWRLRRQLFEAKMIGRYRLSEKLGAGGMGEVWRAYDRSLKTDVALKFLVKKHLEGAGLVRFQREARATSRLSHPNTIRVFDFGWTEEGYPYYAMEYVRGKTLRELVAESGPLSSARAQRLFSQVAAALAEAHSIPLVHRDVKPANIMVTQLGGKADQVKLLDFGLVKMAKGSDTTLTATGWTGGTPSYMAPEVIQGREADARADVYSFGATMYFAVTGQAPFPSDSSLAVLRAHVEVALVAPSVRLGTPLAADLEAVIVRCLQKRPEARFPSCREVAEALEQVDLSRLSSTQPALPLAVPRGDTLTYED